MLHNSPESWSCSHFLGNLHRWSSYSHSHWSRSTIFLDNPCNFPLPLARGTFLLQHRTAKLEEESKRRRWPTLRHTRRRGVDIAFLLTVLDGLEVVRVTLASAVIEGLARFPLLVVEVPWIEAVARTGVQRQLTGILGDLKTKQSERRKG